MQCLLQGQKNTVADGWSAIKNAQDLTLKEVRYAMPKRGIIMNISLIAESQIIGCLIRQPETIDQISGQLNAEHFTDPFCARIYDEISNAMAQEREIGAIELAHKFPDPDTPELLAAMIEGAPARPSLAVKGLSKIVIETHKKTKLAELGKAMAESQDDPDASANVIIENTQMGLDALQEGPSGDAKKSNFQLVEKFKDKIENPENDSGLATGYNALDRILNGLKGGQSLILAGRPGSGKSTVAVNLARNIASTAGGVAFISLEMSSDENVERAIASQSAKMFGPVNAPSHNQMSQTEYRELVTNAANKFSNHPIFWEDSPRMSIDAIRMTLAKARRLFRAKGQELKLAIIDHMGLIRASSRRSSKYEEISDISNRIKELAKFFDIPILTLCQLSRQVEQRDDKRPQLSDLRESGHIEQDADVVLGLYREAYYAATATANNPAEQSELLEKANSKRLEIRVLKNRRGRTGKAELFCDVSRMFVDNWGQDYRGLSA